MNTLILEWNKFIRSKLVVVILGIVLILFGAMFYKNYLDYQQVDADKKHELLMLRVKIEDILYPEEENSVCRYVNDENKMSLLKNSLEITEKTLKAKHSGDEYSYMENAILMYGKIIELHENNIEFEFSKSYSEYEKNRLTEIVKIKGDFQYEEAPLDSILFEYKNIKYILFTVFLISILYFFITTYLDFYYHSGFLFTLPISKKSFVLAKAVISLLINIILIILQLVSCLVFGLFWKWNSNFNYPVFYDITNKFISVSKAIMFYVSFEVVICLITLMVSTFICRIYLSSKNNKIY